MHSYSAPIAEMESLAPHLYPSPDVVEYEHAQVIIVGAGPVGLFLALKLSQQNIDVLVLDAEPTVLKTPRATT